MQWLVLLSWMRGRKKEKRMNKHWVREREEQSDRKRACLGRPFLLFNRLLALTRGSKKEIFIHEKKYKKSEFVFCSREISTVRVFDLKVQKVFCPKSNEGEWTSKVDKRWRHRPILSSNKQTESKIAFWGARCLPALPSGGTKTTKN